MHFMNRKMFWRRENGMIPLLRNRCVSYRHEIGTAYVVLSQVSDIVFPHIVLTASMLIVCDIWFLEKGAVLNEIFCGVAEVMCSTHLNLYGGP